MAVAQGINKKTVYKKQTGLGAAASGAGGQVVRRTSSVFQAPPDTFESNEIVGHQQSTGVGLGVVKPAGKIDGLLSPGRQQLQERHRRKDAGECYQPHRRLIGEEKVRHGIEAPSTAGDQRPSMSWRLR